MRAGHACKYDAICYLEGIAITMGDLASITASLFPSRHTRGFARRRLKFMLTAVVLSGVLGGIAGLVAFEAICEGIGCSRKLRDRYHE